MSNSTAFFTSLNQELGITIALSLWNSRQVKNSKTVKIMTTFKFQKHVLTTTIIMLGRLMYKAVKVEFIISRKMLICDNKMKQMHESIRI